MPANARQGNPVHGIAILTVPSVQSTRVSGPFLKPVSPAVCNCAFGCSFQFRMEHHSARFEELASEYASCGHQGEGALSEPPLELLPECSTSHVA